MSACTRQRTLPETHYGDTGTTPSKVVRCVLNADHVGYHVDEDGLPFGPWIETSVPPTQPPAVEDYLRATAEAFGLSPDAAVAHLDQTLAANRKADQMPAQHPAAPETETDANGLEVAARAVAEAAGDGCFERIDQRDCGCDNDCSDHEDAAYYRSLARAALGSVERIVAERVRVVEGERDAARAERDEMSGWIEEHALVKTLAQIAEWQEATGAELPAMARAAMHAYAARAESAEAAHRALQAAVEALADEWEAGTFRSVAAESLRALLAGGEER